MSSNTQSIFIYGWVDNLSKERSNKTFFFCFVCRFLEKKLWALTKEQFVLNSKTKQRNNCFVKTIVFENIENGPLLCTGNLLKLSCPEG